MDINQQLPRGLVILEDDVRELIRQSGLDPVVDQAQAKQVIAQALQAYEHRMIRGSLPLLEDMAAASDYLVNTFCGFGPLQPFLDDPSIEEIWINSPREVFIARGGESQLTGLHLSDETVKHLVERMLKISGRRLDLSSPFVDAALPDGSRLHVVIPDITRQHWSVNIRKFIARARRLSDLVKLGSLTSEASHFLDAAVAAGLNILVSGATQAGKTTMLNCLAASIGQRERVLSCEEIFELNIPLRDVVAMQCRQANLEGKGEIPLRKLVKEALRMRPDRLLIGEVREAEALDMLIALNSGLPGMCTIHANSGRDAITKICTLPLLAGTNISSQFVLPTVASCFDLVVHCQRDGRGQRQVQEIIALGSRVENGLIETSTVFARRGQHLLCQAAEVPAAEKFLRAGYRLEEVLPLSQRVAA